MPDDLTAALADDLDGAFERVVLDYQDRLFGFVLRLTGSAPDAEEVVQDAFVRAYGALRRYPGERVRSLHLRPWLYQIALNLARNRARRARLRLVPLDGSGSDDVPEPRDDDRRGPEAVLDRAERRDELAAHVAALPERYRAALVLRHVQGVPYDEIGQILGQPVGTVKANVHRGVGLLRQALAQYETAPTRLLEGVR